MKYSKLLLACCRKNHRTLNLKTTRQLLIYLMWATVFVRWRWICQSEECSWCRPSTSNLNTEEKERQRDSVGVKPQSVRICIVELCVCYIQKPFWNIWSPDTMLQLCSSQLSCHARHTWVFLHNYALHYITTFIRLLSRLCVNEDYILSTGLLKFPFYVSITWL